LVYTLSYSSVHESELDLVGSRSLFLGRALSKGINSCLFFVITSTSFKDFFEFNSLGDKIKNLEGDDSSFWASLKGLFSSSSFPDSIKSEIRESYDALSVSDSAANTILRSFEARVNVLVSSNRTSGFDNIFLNIKGFDNVLSAIKSSWFSYLKSINLSSLRSGSFNFCGVIIEKFVSSDFCIEVEVISKSDNLMISAYKGLPEVSLGIVKDLFVLSFNHLEFLSYELNNQNFSILHQEESGVLLKKRLGREGSDNKVSKNLVSECARIAKRVFSFFESSLKVVFVVRKDVPFLFLVDGLNSVSEDSDSLLVEDSNLKVDNVEESRDNIIDVNRAVSDVIDDSFHLSDENSTDNVPLSQDDSLSDDLVEDSDSFEGEDSDEFIVQGDSEIDSSDDIYSSFFKLVNLLEEDILKTYKESFGFDPNNFKEAILELDSKHGFSFKNKLLRVFEVKELIMQGERVDEDIVSSLIGVIEDFLIGDDA
jgi:hypothetical protein